jgi:tellurite resistance protein
MNPNSKAQTIKIPRQPLSAAAKERMLDVLVACASNATHHRPADRLERKKFEEYIMSSEDMSPQMKQALAQLSEQERAVLFS